MIKRCADCELDKPITEFYRDRQKADGLMARCKACANAAVQRFRRTDSGVKSRRATEAKYRAIPEGRENRRIGHKLYRKRHPGKVVAHMAVSHAIRSGELVPQPCAQCGYPVTEAHHPDYSKPLEIVWLCRKHHSEAHRDCDDSSSR